jgi:hypothetical protein
LIISFTIIDYATLWLGDFGLLPRALYEVIDMRTFGALHYASSPTEALDRVVESTVPTWHGTLNFSVYCFPQCFSILSAAKNLM